MPVDALDGDARRILLTALAACLLAAPSAARADRIGGSNLPPATPALKGRIAEGDGATSVAVIGASVGATSNAGPTLLETASPFVDRAFGYATVRDTLYGRLDFSLNLSDRHYTDFDEANERSAAAALNLTKDWAGQQTLVALAVGRTRDVEERLTEASLSVTHAWTGGTAKPYVKAETAWLDYDDMPGEIEPFRNQDDRDRISSRAELGLRLTLAEHVEVQVGAGIDAKRYLDPRDDFGVRRGGVSVFPLVGLAYSGDWGALRALYMPLRRTWREDLFPNRWTHAYAVEGDFALRDGLKAFAAVRYGFQETDFLLASSAYEAVVLGGLTLSVGKGSVSFAASHTWRTYDDLDLIAVDRADEKLEVALTGEMPLTEAASLNGRIGYLSYRSSFGDVATDALTASLGVTYALAQ